eukprot:CAMPEP_0171328816 /NCGR_PEP_ID=MMETSP0878-20121228/862_1 /TAXON_ID=67004 /ORGANISM="Thalassiosira weissflogii, Strain CCMP1336" /LENGTH=589 /DNA_ID=CAMNT_0011828693 /DNA_START=6 /DNA_END=1775 /DNA_ORIENTATION=+
MADETLSSTTTPADDSTATETQPAAVVDDNSPPENDGAAPSSDVTKTNGTNSVANSGDAKDGSPRKGGGKGGRGGGKGGKKDKKDEVPIEELYDLSKPIKRIERPSKQAHDEALAALDATIESLQKQRRAAQSKIDAAMGNTKNKNTPLARERDALNKLKNRKGLMVEQKRQIRTRFEVVKSKSDKLMGEAKNARSSMKFSNLSDIEKEIARLQRKHETSSMSLAEEKKLIKEIDALQASKRTAQDLLTKEGDIGSIKEQRRLLQGELQAKDKEIDVIQKEIDEQSKVVNELMDKQSSQRGQVEKLVEERDAIKAKIDEAYAEKSNLWTEFRSKTNDWYNNQRAIKAQRQIQHEEEKKRRDEEHAAWLKKKEEEELKKVPYEEEMSLCDYLADYLTKTYLAEGKAAQKEKDEELEKKGKEDVVAVKDDPFAGMVARNKKNDDEEIYFGKGKGGKKTKSSKKSSKSNKAPTFSLNIDLFEQFGLLNLTPPTNLEAVESSVEELKAKKVWYSEQPRGSVPTARDIREANKNKEAENNKKAQGSRKGNNGKKGNFSISSDDFVPLGGGSVTVGSSEAANSNWGKPDSAEASE